MWPGSSPSAVVNGAAGMTIAALLVAGLYGGQDLLSRWRSPGFLDLCSRRWCGALRVGAIRRAAG
jgi:hypothetical protein